MVDLPTAQQLGSDGVEWEPYCWSEDLAKEFLGKLGGGVSMALGFGDFLVLCWWLLVCLLVSFTVLLMVILRGSVEERLRSEAAKSVSADGAVAWEDLGSAACSAVAPGMAGLGLTDTGPQVPRFGRTKTQKHI